MDVKSALEHKHYVSAFLHAAYISFYAIVKLTIGSVWMSLGALVGGSMKSCASCMKLSFDWIKGKISSAGERAKCTTPCESPAGDECDGGDGRGGTCTEVTSKRFFGSQTTKKYVCQKCVAYGGACGEDSDCKTGSCGMSNFRKKAKKVAPSLEGTCTVVDRPGGSLCENSWECGSGTCVTKGPYGVCKRTNDDKKVIVGFNNKKRIKKSDYGFGGLRCGARYKKNCVHGFSHSSSEKLSSPLSGTDRCDVKQSICDKAPPSDCCIKTLGCWWSPPATAGGEGTCTLDPPGKKLNACHAGRCRLHQGVEKEAYAYSGVYRK